MATAEERDTRKLSNRSERDLIRDARRKRRQGRREKRKERRKVLIGQLKKFWLNHGAAACSKLEDLRKSAPDLNNDGTVSDEEVARWAMKKPKDRVPDTWEITLPLGIKVKIEDLVGGAVYIFVRGLFILCRHDGKLDEDQLEGNLETLSEEDEVIDDVDDEDSDFIA
jgi:hypothetical protein